MGRIQRMDPHLANMIAAGEVVERPVNVIKELIENSIDAGATSIKIDLMEAGLKQIRLLDNGSGMDETDLMMAFERHATSKIKTEYDLFHITSLGFRGEALPSIASVSQVIIQSSVDGVVWNNSQIESGKMELAVEGFNVAKLKHGNSPPGRSAAPICWLEVPRASPQQSPDPSG